MLKYYGPLITRSTLLPLGIHRFSALTYHFQHVVSVIATKFANRVIRIYSENENGKWKQISL